MRTVGRSVSGDQEQGIKDIKEKGLKKRRRKSTYVKMLKEKTGD